MNSGHGTGTASAVPVLPTDAAGQLARADQWESEALRAIESVQDPDEAETLLREVTALAEVVRLSKIAAEREQQWRSLRLRAERRYGELLGPAEVGTNRHTSSVTSGNTRSGAERKAQNQAREVYLVPEDIFEQYLATELRPTRSGLLRSGRSSKPKRRKRGGEPSVQPRDSAAQSVDVLNWVRRHHRRGLSRAEIVALSNTADDWPMPGETLSDVTCRSILTAIHHLEQQGAHFPLKPAGGTLGSRNGPTPLGKRQHQVRQARAAARRAGDPVVLWDTAYQITKLTGLLTSLNIEDADLDEHGVDTVSDLYDDMLLLQDWADRVAFAVHGRLGELPLLNTLTRLRARTVENGCTPEEEDTARRMAARLERRLASTLATSSA